MNLNRNFWDYCQQQVAGTVVLMFLQVIQTISVSLQLSIQQGMQQQHQKERKSPHITATAPQLLLVTCPVALPQKGHGVSLV